MKKIVLFSAIALFLFTLSSCEKEHNVLPLNMNICSCEDAVFNGSLKDVFAVVKYDNHVKSAVLILKVRNCGSVLNVDNSNKQPLHFIPCKESAFPTEYRVEGLKVKISGDYKTCNELDANKYFIIKVSSIQEIKN